MTEYRRHKGSTADQETIALRELAHRVKRLRARVIFPVAAVAIVAGHVGIAAHATGHWSIFGVGSDGTYYVAPITIAFAFVLPAIPFAIVAWILHRVLSRRLRRAWCDEFADRYGIARETLEQNAGRYG